MEILAGEKAEFFFISEKEGNAFRFNWETEEMESFEHLGGIMLEAVKGKDVVEVIEPGRNSLYNPKYDLDTDLPIITCPVLDLKREKVLGVFQGVNLKSNVKRTFGTHNSIDSELIRNLATIIYYSMTSKNLEISNKF